MIAARGRPCQARHPELQPVTCRWCWHCASRSELSRLARRRWGCPEPGPDVPDPGPWRAPAAVPASNGVTAGGRPSPLACVHRGEPTGGEVLCGSCGGRRTMLKVFACSVHGECVMGKPAEGEPASCLICPDRAPPPALPPRSVVVPQPPPLHLAAGSMTLGSPTRKALVTVAAGQRGRELLAVSRPLMERYAARVGADFLVLDWPGHPDWPMSCKYAIATVLEHYDRLAYVDADVILPPGCVDLFAACPEGAFGAVDELPWHLRHPRHGILRHYRAFRQAHGFPDLPEPPYYLNCGVFVASKHHAPWLLPPRYALEVHNLSEQHHTNAALLASGAWVYPLPEICNHQHWTDHNFRNAPPDAVLHLSGMAHAPRLALMRRLAGLWQ